MYLMLEQKRMYLQFLAKTKFSKIFANWAGIITLRVYSQNILPKCLLFIAELTLSQIPKELSTLTVAIPL